MSIRTNHLGLPDPFRFESAPERVQKVNRRRLHRAISKFRKELQHELEGDIHIAFSCSIPWLEEINGQPTLAKGQEYFIPGNKSTKGEKRR